MMRTFGSYEAVEELSRTAFGAVYSARPSGSAPKPGAPPAHFVKVFAPPALDDAGVRAGTQTENFLAAARLQQKASSSSPHWAPVHEIGTSAEGAYYVSSLYPMSARRLVMGRVKLTDADLHALVSAILQGLKDLRASCEQAHGNIKLTTVLLPRSGHAAYGQAVLAEPLLPHKAAAVTEATDLADVAKLIYHLVVHRAFSDAGGWPIPAGAAWSRLGARGEAWRELCNALLDPGAAGDASRGLDWLSGALEGLKPRRQLVSAKMRVAAVAVMLLGGIGYALFAHYAPYFRYSAGDWTRLADAYGGWLRALDQGDPELDVAQQLDPDLREIVAELKRADVVFDTKRIFGDEAKDYAYDDAGLRDLRPKTAEAQRLTRRAVEYLPVVEERLKRWKPAVLAARVGDRCKAIAPAVEAELLALLERTSTAPPADGSGRAPTAIDFANAMAKLARLAPVLDGIDKDLTAVEEVERSLSAQRIGDGPVFRDIRDRLAATYRGATSVADLSDRLAGVKAAINSINGDWSALSPVLTQAYDRDDEVLKLVPEFVRLALGEDEDAAGVRDGASVAALQRRVQKLRVRFTERPWSDLQARSVDWGAGRIDKEEFRKSAPYTELAGRSPGALLGAWVASAGEYVKLPIEQDPRVALAAGAAKLDGALKELDADYPPPAPASPEVREVKAEADAWRVALSELQKPKWLGGQRSDIERRANEGAQKLAALLVAVEAARSVPETVREEYIAGVRERGERLAHPLLRRKSQAEQQVWFKDAAVWRRDPKSLKPPTFRKVQEVVKLAEKRLTEMDALSSRLDVEPGPQPPPWHGALVAELEKLAEAELANAVNAGLGFGDWSSLAGDDFEKRWPAVRDAYRAWVEDATRLVANLSLVEALLDGGYGLQPAVNEAYSSATKSRHWTVAGAKVGALVARIEVLQKLPNDRAALLAATREKDASLAVAAWRRLGTPDWPGEVNELDEELRIQKLIEERVERLNGAGTRWPAADPLLQKFRKDLEAERYARRQSAWLRLAEKTEYPQDARRQRLDAVMARMTQCDIAFPPTGSPELKPETRFNVALYRFREELQAYRRLAQPNAAAGEEMIKEQDRRATSRLAGFKNDLPAELRNQKWVTDALVKLEEQAKPMDRRQVVAAEDGPRAPRVTGIVWNFKSDARDEVRTYTWGRHTLRFRRLEQPPGSSGDAVFLCTSEVPLGLFKDVIDVAAAEAKADRLRFAGLNAPGFLQGPHVWDRALRPQLTWLPNVRDDFRGKYAPRFKAVDQQLKDRGLEMPMQRVPAAAAMHFAHLVGCRLPTSGEFDLARGMRAVAGEAIANLRDPAWAEQQAFLLDVVANAGADAEDWAPWPDFGTFDAGADIPSRAQAQPAQGVKDDGHLWFRPVHSADDTFGDLTGNVAEWLWDDVKVLEEAAKDQSFATFRGIVTNNWRGKLWIAGASAMSTFTPGPDRHGVTNPAGSFADVGFRLAFTVPSRTIVDRMWLVADKQPYAVAAVGSAGRARPE